MNQAAISVPFAIGIIVYVLARKPQLTVIMKALLGLVCLNAASWVLWATTGAGVFQDVWYGSLGVACLTLLVGAAAQRGRDRKTRILYWTGMAFLGLTAVLIILIQLTHFGGAR